MSGNKKFLFAILVLAAVLRFGFLSRGDVVNDEVFSGFRAIGMMDFDEAPLQPTPWEWTDPDVPFWAHLSFHDDPPLSFIAQHFSMAVFGVNNFGMRFPSAALGILAVWLVYLIGKRLFSEKAGLIGAFIYAITINGIYISRLGLIESYAVFFILLAFWVFLLSLENNKKFLWLGAVLGLAFLTKYTAFVLVPIFLAYLIFYRRDLLKDKNLWLGLFIAVLIFSPVIFYNIKLYQLSGHFDFQFSALLKQNTPEWPVQTGKDIGSIKERISAFPTRLLSSNSWLFLLLFAVSAIFYTKEWKRMNSRLRPLLPLFLCLTAVFVALIIGPSYRFLSMFGPFMALAVGFAADYAYKTHGKWKKALIVGLIIVAAFEIFYSCNNLIAYYPAGGKYWLASPLRNENYNFGYNELDGYLKNELSEKMPALTFTAKYKFLEDAKQSGLANASAQKLSGYPAMIIYGGEWSGLARLWVLERRHIYEGWPVLSVRDYFGYLQELGFDYFDRSGFGVHYFIWPSASVPNEIEKSLMQGEKETIYNKKGEEVFQIYKF